MKTPRSVSAVLAAGALSLAAATVPAPAHATPGWSSMGSGEVREGASLSGSFERGSIISVKELSDDLVLTGASRGWLFEYATEGPHGQQATSLGTLYVPPGLAPSGGWPVVSYGHGTQGLGDKNISYPHWVGEDNTGDQYLSAWLNAGFAVAATEYVGLGTEGDHPYLNSHSEGAAMIDAVRAARSVSGGLSTTFVTNGYSQGGQAAIAAGAMAADYAPELTLAATTTGGVPAGVADELSAVSPALQIAQPDVVDLMQNRQAFAERIAQNIAPELKEQGLVLDSFQIKGITDSDGYIQSLGAPEIEARRREAEIARAAAEREIRKKNTAVEEQNLTEFRALEINKAEAERDVKTAQAEAQQAESLIRAERE